MALDDEAYDNAQASSVLKALRENDGIKNERQVITGNAYSSGNFFGQVADGATVNLFIENPANSGNVIFPQSIFRSGGQIRFSKTDSVTVDTAGTATPIQNRLIADGSADARVEHGIVFSGGNQWSEKATGGAQSGGGLAPTSTTDFSLILQEGENVVYTATNISGASIRMTIDIDFVELDKEEISEFAR